MTGPRCAGAILAGGRASRFGGGPKHEALLSGEALIDHVIRRATPQVARLGISVAADSGAIRPHFDTIRDMIAGKGPLGGVHSGLVWAAALEPPASWLATFASDTPVFPGDLVARLIEAATKAGAAAAIASSGGRIHPTFAVWRTELAALANARLGGGDLSLQSFASASAAIIVDFAGGPENSFINVNTAEDLRALGPGE